MKRSLFFVGMGAMALATPLFLSSCSSSDDAASETPTPYTGEAVKTSFTLSVGLPKGNGSNGAKAFTGTRMTDDITQAQSTLVFRGMDNMTLIPFHLGTAGNTLTGTETRLGDSNIKLPNTVANSVAKDQLTTKGNAKVYTDVSVPTTTNAFLFYGKAIDNEAGQPISSADDKFKFGTLTAVGLDAGNPTGINFTPTQIAPSPKTEKAEAIATYLTSIANAKDWSTVTADAQGNGSALVALYNNFITMSAGSSKSVQLALQDLYTSLESLKNSQTSANQTIITAIETAITDKATVGTDGTLTLKDEVAGYPEDNNLPDGAATVSWSTTDKKFTASQNSSYTKDAVLVSAFTSYVYPANLWYRANTAIKTSDDALNSEYKNDVDWPTILGKYNEDNGTVTASTRSIALKDQIQYAVARLDTKVTCAAGTLYDHNGAVIALKDGGFPVTGILVGGQKKVDWQFQPSTTSDATQYTVYDKEMNSTTSGSTTTKMIASTSGSIYNHTLLLESSKNQAVNMVVELENNTGKAFYGHNKQVIPAGSKFYMVAQLNPSAGTQPQSPGTAFDNTKVFQQDFTTIANLKIVTNDDGEHDKGLGAAYNVIPDLRTPALSIGLSVDLNWQAGLTFDVDM
jgi:hypothetical protein